MEQVEKLHQKTIYVQMYSRIFFLSKGARRDCSWPVFED